MKQSIGSGRGSVYNIIMKALQSGDKYGYEICQEIEQKTNGNYILKQPSLYSGLKRLEAQKLVESYWGDSDIGGRRHYYKLTDQGRRKIEQTNFSWEDERNDLVDAMFQKSEVDKNIDEIKTELSTAETSLFNAQKTNDDIKNTFDGTNSDATIVKTNSNNSFGHKVNENQVDLFSSGLLSSNTNDKQNESTQVVEEKQSSVENLDNENQEKLEQPEPLKENQTSDEQIGEKLNQKIDFDAFMGQNSTSFYNNKETKQDSPIMLEDLEKSPTFMGGYNKTQTITQQPQDDFDALYENFKKSLEEEQVVQSEIQTSSVETSTTPQYSNFDEQERLAQEKYMSDVLSGNLNAPSYQLHQVEIEHNIESLTPANVNTTPQSTLQEIDSKTTNLTEDLGYSKDFVDDFNNINFKSIFGDVYDDSDKQYQFNFKNENLETENTEQQTENIVSNKNKLEYANNINLSLDSSQYTTNTQYGQNKNYKRFEQDYYDKVNTSADNQSSTFNTTQNVAFDKKCANHGYNYTDYEIRYLRKNIPDLQTSMFTKIGALSFTSNCLISLLALALTLILTFTLSPSILEFGKQKLFLVLNYCIIGLYFIINVIIFSQNKHRRVIYSFETKQFLKKLIFAIILFGIVFVCNNLAGMTIKNIGNYCFSFILPCVMLILYAIQPIFNKIFSKLSYYAK